MNFCGEIDIDVVEDNFMFIEEVIAGYAKDMQEGEPVHDIVESALNSDASLSVDDKDKVLSQVEFQSDNFKKGLIWLAGLTQERDEEEVYI